MRAWRRQLEAAQAEAVGPAGWRSRNLVWGLPLSPVVSTDRKRTEAVAGARANLAMHGSAVATEEGFRNHFPAQQRAAEDHRHCQ